MSEVDPTRNGDILDPSPRLVSNKLLARPKKSDGSDDFTPATILNLLAAAWIQFQTHDWFNHGTPRPIDDDPFDVPIPQNDSWPGGKMLVRRTRADPTRKPNDGAGPIRFTNAETHWTVRRSTATARRPAPNTAPSSTASSISTPRPS
ncbi:MAG: peroxidase family protein [Xanthobacteraceae bacterium]